MPKENKTHPFKRSAIALLLQASLATGALMPMHMTHAAEPAAAEAKTYAIAAGPLGAALSRFATQAGVLLSFDPVMTKGKTTAGLNGSYSVREGFELLLQGSGLSVRQEIDGSYSLTKAQELKVGAENTLPEVSVNARREKVTITEGSRSYAINGPVSTATRLPLTLRETPQSVSVMTRQRIEDENLRSIESVLDRMPGISVQNIGSSRYGISSRGYGIDNLQLDGILTAMDLVSQNIPQAQADLVIYDRVEVLRGAAGLLTGAGDPSGTINLVRKKPTYEFQGYASVGIGSWDRHRVELDVAGPLNESGSLRGRFVGAYEKGGTHIDYYDTEKSVLYGILEADLSERTVLTAGLDYQKSDPRGIAATGLPLFYSNGQQTDFSPEANAASRWSKNEVEVYNAFLKLEHTFTNDWTLKFSANHLHGERNYSLAYAGWGFPDQATGSGTRLYGGVGSATQRQTGFDAQVGGPFEWLGRRHEAVLGFNWSEFENFHEPMRGAGIEGRYVNIYEWGNETTGPTITGQKLMDYDGWQKQYGTYGALRLKPRDDLSVILGARISNYQYQLSQIYTSAALAGNNRITNMQETGVLTPYTGIVYDLNGTHSVYASYTSIFKPQSLRNRNGVVLDPRDGDNYEIGLKSEFFGGRLNSAIALYEIRQDNLAEVDAGQTVPGTSPAQPAYRAVSGAKTRGIDVEINGEIDPGWQISASYNYSTTEDSHGDRINTTFPRQMAKVWTSYRMSGIWNKLTFGGGVNWQDSIYYTATSSGLALKGEQASYTVVNLMARYDINEPLSATLNVNNVFDKEYLQGLDNTFHTAIYAPTCNAWLNLRYNF
ncbi:TonB-dependent siderophore receptor [Methylobacillus sp. Pita2]|uniref:TonB-dependent siderophore receptor n=1 Tax=Methylobacillus sp. Pita2 TaxID=3383245 RepID=UPI0038B4C7C8